MAKILCGISGIEFSVPHIPMSLTSRESHHPIFDIPPQRLLTLLPRWLEQELSDTENYLLYLAVFKSTNLMDFRVPACAAKHTSAMIAMNMAPLAAIVETILDSSEARKQEILRLPTFVITADTKDLSDSPEWIKIWVQCYADYANHYRTATALEKMQRKETILERHIKDKTKDISTYAHQLANWAAQAGAFPDFDAGLDKSIMNGAKISLSTYWQYIIKCCAKTEAIWEIPDADLTELIEHCEEHIDHGSIYSHTLMSLLRAGAERKKNFLDLGDIDIGANGTTFRILDGSASIEDANKLAAIDSAPLIEPKESFYPNKLAFIKAKLNWKLAQDYKNQRAVADKIAEINTEHNKRIGDQ